jgi:uncharacterized protein YkwD
MKYLFGLLLVVFSNGSGGQTTSLRGTGGGSPLAAYSVEWNNPVYDKCNTASKALYMKDTERAVIYILNLARTYPSLFAKTVLAKYPSVSGNDILVNDQYYYQSLVKEMLAMQPAPLLYADEKCFNSAICHAKTSGKSGYTGHNRQTANCGEKKYFSAECCDYGNEEPLEIVLSLLIDTGVPSLGHRRALLGTYARVGVSIQPHKTYQHNTVLDFDY